MPAQSRSMAAAIEDVARGLRAEAVVLSAASPALPQLRIPAMLLHRVELLHRFEPVGQDAHQRESDWIPAQSRWTSRQR